MLPLLVRLQNSQPIRYIFIGGISYIIEMAALLALAHLLLLSPEISVAYSFWVGLVVSFVLQKYIAFNNKTSHKKVITTQALLYGALVLFNYSFTIVFVSLSVGLLGLVIARTLALITTTVWNYFIYKQLFKAR